MQGLRRFCPFCLVVFSFVFLVEKKTERRNNGVRLCFCRAAFRKQHVAVLVANSRGDGRGREGPTIATLGRMWKNKEWALAGEMLPALAHGQLASGWPRALVSRFSAVEAASASRCQ